MSNSDRVAQPEIRPGLKIAFQSDPFQNSVTRVYPQSSCRYLIGWGSIQSLEKRPLSLPPVPSPPSTATTTGAGPIDVMMASIASSSLAFRPAMGKTAMASADRRPLAFFSPRSFPHNGAGVRVRKTSSYVRCCAGDVPPPTVSETKSNFLRAYNRPIPSVYNTVLQELIVQQHLMRYKRSYQYDPIFALGFVTVYDQLMEGYPSDEDRDAIFRAHIRALKEDPDLYRTDAKKLEEWARSQNGGSLCEFPSREGEVEGVLKGIAERAAGRGTFSYSRFFAIGLFRLIESANATAPATLEKLCAALNINKRSVDRDLDIYRNLLTKLVQAKELLKEYVDREKKKREERMGNQKADGAVTK